MFVMNLSSLLTLKAVVLSLLQLLMIMQNEQVEAKMVDIYNKHLPKITINRSTLNFSASNIIPLKYLHKDSISRSTIEYNSPIKRIMELISQHAPVIVVSSSSNNNNDRQPERPPHAHPPPRAQTQQVHNSGPFIGMPAQHQHQQSAASNQQVDLNQFQNTNPTFITSTSNSDPQQWALMETNPMVQSLVSTTSDSQPQIISTGLPFDQTQYQIHQVSDGGNQITLQVPSQQLSFAEPSNGVQQQQQLATFPADSQQIFFHNPNQDQQQQQHLAQQQLQTQEERAQPIFLSSYVPELQVNGRDTASAAPMTNPAPLILPEQSPDSIQDIQSKANQESAAGKESLEGPEGGDEGDGETSKPHKSLDESGENDIEEPQHSNNQQQTDQDPEEPNNNDSGSITYEDKYDSDKDEPRSADTSAASPQSSPTGDSKAEASGLVNGLINVGLNDDCLQCICRAASGCDHLLRCITRGSEEKYCGPFQLTEEYWNMAGSPGDASTNFSSFEDCANEADCAVETVTNYMKKYHKDCDGDSNITCMDYARLHKLRPDECGNTEKLVNSFDAYWAKFQRCAESYNRSRTGDDEDI